MAKPDEPERDDEPYGATPDSDKARSPPQPSLVLDPFATFTEWASEADTAGYANLGTPAEAAIDTHPD